MLSEVLLVSTTKDKKNYCPNGEEKKNIWNKYAVRHTVVEHTHFSTTKHTLEAENMQITQIASVADVP